MIRQLLLVAATVGAIALSPNPALADGKHGWKNGWKNSQEARHHYRDHRWAKRWSSPRHYRPHWRYRSGYRDRYWANAYLGGALFGTAITYGLAHDHHNCRDHGHESFRGNSRGNITGCYRIEQLPDGRERRVELPLSECR